MKWFRLIPVLAILWFPIGCGGGGSVEPDKNEPTADLSEEETAVEEGLVEEEAP